MLTVYEKLICDLKNKLKNTNIKFKHLFSLINKQKYNKIIEIIHDETIYILIDNIIIERERIANNINDKLNDLLWLNDRLIQFGENPQLSKTKALKLLKRKVFINIYDLEAEKYEHRTTKEKLIKELRYNPEIRFPLDIAKDKINLKCFLIKL